MQNWDFNLGPPKKGLYYNLLVVDVSSLYPAMAVLYNISFDIVNCECCRNNPDAMVDKEITKDCIIEKIGYVTTDPNAKPIKLPNMGSVNLPSDR
jgi:DNA polymerase elongation subunit (family B)